uniref:Uncharacterized protein n=1 Tax=Hyaloperonospora arabidopsidis (strain Emoy2) TaxID=559515 RepID=M4BW04_HYAAE
MLERSISYLPGVVMSPRPCSSHLVKDRLVRRNSAGDGALFTRCRRSRLKIDEDDARDEGDE